MKRRRSREYALQILFQLELSGKELDEQTWNDFWDSIEEEDEVKEYTLQMVKTTRANLEEIDKILHKAAQHWLSLTGTSSGAQPVNCSTGMTSHHP